MELGPVLTVGALAVVLDTTMDSVALRILATEMAVGVVTVQ